MISRQNEVLKYLGLEYVISNEIIYDNKIYCICADIDCFKCSNKSAKYCINAVCGCLIEHKNHQLYANKKK